MAAYSSPDRQCPCCGTPDSLEWVEGHFPFWRCTTPTCGSSRSRWQYRNTHEHPDHSDPGRVTGRRCYQDMESDKVFMQLDGLVGLYVSVTYRYPDGQLFGAAGVLERVEQREVEGYTEELPDGSKRYRGEYRQTWAELDWGMSFIVHEEGLEIETWDSEEQYRRETGQEARP